MLNKINISFNKTDCLSEQMLKDYQQGLLSKEQIRMVELHLADCEICNDYVEGLSLLSNSNELETESQIIINKINKKNTKKNKIWLFAAAASIFIAISLSSIILFFPSKNKYIADNSINISQKNDTPNETKPLEELSWKKDESEAAVDEISRKEQSKIIEKSALIDKTKGTGEGSQLEDGKRNGSNYRTEMSGGVISQQSKEQNQAIVSNNIVTVNDESKGIAGDIVTKAPLKSETSTEKVLAEEKLESQARKEDENVTLLAKSESNKDKKTEEKITKSPNKNAPASNEQNVANTGISAGYVDKVSDLDDANYYLSKQKNDSLIVLALRGASSTNDSIKWKSKLLLAKAYLASGEKEKAIELFKEIKKNSKARFKKEAQKELEKLGY